MRLINYINFYTLEMIRNLENKTFTKIIFEYTKLAIAAPRLVAPSCGLNTAAAVNRNLSEPTMDTLGVDGLCQPRCASQSYSNNQIIEFRSPAHPFYLIHAPFLISTGFK